MTSIAAKLSNAACAAAFGGVLALLAAGAVCAQTTIPIKAKTAAAVPLPRLVSEAGRHA